MGYELADKRVLVTGASSGIGAALAEGFARAGAVVGICARRAERLADVLERVRVHSPASRRWTVDLAELDGIAAFARAASDELGGIDVLVNNAGIPKRRWLADLDAATVESVMRINFFSPVRLTLALLPELIARSGRVVNISSVAARFSPPCEAAYSASKAALTSWSESMQADLLVAGHDVAVHVVNPGVIDTELFELPDNETSLADVEALPADAIVGPVLEQLRSGTFEIFVPDWFADVAKGKADDVGAFVRASADYLRSRLDATTTS